MVEGVADLENVFEKLLPRCLIDQIFEAHAVEVFHYIKESKSLLLDTRADANDSWVGKFGEHLGASEKTLTDAPIVGVCLVEDLERNEDTSACVDRTPHQPETTAAEPREKLVAILSPDLATVELCVM